MATASVSFNDDAKVRKFRIVSKFSPPIWADFLHEFAQFSTNRSFCAPRSRNSPRQRDCVSSMAVRTGYQTRNISPHCHIATLPH